MIDKILETLMYVVLIFMTVALIWYISVPLWSESKDVCEYWHKTNDGMICIKKTRIWCYGKCDEVKNETY